MCGAGVGDIAVKSVVQVIFQSGFASGDTIVESESNLDDGPDAMCKKDGSIVVPWAGLLEGRTQVQRWQSGIPIRRPSRTK